MNQPVDKQTLAAMRENSMAKGYVSATGCYIEKGRGAVLVDVEGKEYIDFGGGIAVMNVGHSHPRVVAAIKDQAEKLTHTCYMVMPYAPAVQLAEKLCRLVPGNFEKSAVMINSGAEAVENAVKIARYSTGRQAVIAFENGFHGRTYVGMSLTSKVKPYKFGFGPFVPEIYRMPFAYCYRCPFNLTYPGCAVACADYIEDYFIHYVAPETTAAIIAEPVQGEGGFICPPPEYFPKLKGICEKYGILLIADEIQTGVGRTGTMFAMEHWNVAAEITTVAKSLAAGLPLSAVIGRKDIMDSVHAGGICGTYGGNPVACRAALAVLEVFETENLLQKAEALGRSLRKRLDDFKQRYEIIGDVRGLGPMLAMELVADRETKKPAAEQTKSVAAYCLERGLMVLTCGSYGNVIRLLMPLVITDRQLEKGLTVLEEGLASVNP